MNEDDRFLQALGRDLRSDVEEDGDGPRRVMERVRGSGSDPPGDLAGTGWILRLTPFRLVTAAAVAGLALAAAWLAGRAGVPSTRSGDPPGAVDPAAVSGGPEEGRNVQFVVVVEDAQEVALVGDFNDWDPELTPMARASEAGVWSVTIPLSPGPHRYAFVVDEERWMADPDALRAPEDPFDQPSSITWVGAGS